VGGEQSLDASFAAFGLAAEAELACDDGSLSPRSAWLLVGCTPSIASNVHNAGQISAD
jgi:hypothetical protein